MLTDLALKGVNAVLYGLEYAQTQLASAQEQLTYRKEWNEGKSYFSLLTKFEDIPNTIAQSMEDRDIIALSQTNKEVRNMFLNKQWNDAAFRLHLTVTTEIKHLFPNNEQIVRAFRRQESVIEITVPKMYDVSPNPELTAALNLKLLRLTLSAKPIDAQAMFICRHLAQLLPANQHFEIPLVSKTMHFYCEVNAERKMKYDLCTNTMHKTRIEEHNKMPMTVIVRVEDF